MLKRRLIFSGENGNLCHTMVFELNLSAPFTVSKRSDKQNAYYTIAIQDFYKWNFEPTSQDTVT